SSHMAGSSSTTRISASASIGLGYRPVSPKRSVATGRGQAQAATPEVEPLRKGQIPLATPRTGRRRRIAHKQIGGRNVADPARLNLQEKRRRPDVPSAG